MRIKTYLESFVRKSYAAHEPVSGHETLLDCSLGVNMYGVSKKVLEAAKDYDWSQVWLCPDPTYRDLKGAIVEFWSGQAEIQTNQIQIGHGSMEVLERINRIFLETGSKVLGYAPQFTGYVADIGACGAHYDPVILRPEERFKFFAERFAEKIGSGYNLIYIDNPNNPTGQMITLECIEEMVREAKKMGVAVIVDEAYADYAEQRHSAVNLINKYANLMVVRTFDKGFGLCSLRVGYGIVPNELSGYLNKVAPPFRATAISSYLATAAISDRNFITNCRQRIKPEKEELINGLKRKGYLVGESYEYCPIFLLGHKDQGIDLMQELLSKGILTVPGTDFEHLGKNYVRINCPVSAEEFLGRLR